MKNYKKKKYLIGTQSQCNFIQNGDKINRQNINKSYCLLYLLVALIVVVFGIISYSKFGVSLYDIIENIVGNLMGVFAAFLVFDIVNDKLSKELQSKEMSKNILEALMAKPETLDSFTQEQRNRFIFSTVKSSVKDEDIAEMISNQCIEYLSKNNYDRIKLKFDYKFEIKDTLPSVFNCFSDISEYYYIQEIFGYTVRHIDNKPSCFFDGSVYVGLLFDNKSLDGVFRASSSDCDFNKCIFRENLDIKKEDISYLRTLPATDFQSVIEKMFKLSIQIDQYSGKLHSAELKPNGILIRFDVDINDEIVEHNVRLIFHMPKLYGTILQVVISDPTKAPKITVSYPEESIHVEMYSFLSKGRESSYEVAHEKANGIFDIALNSEWIYPISGMVFTVEKKQSNKKDGKEVTVPEIIGG